MRRLLFVVLCLALAPRFAGAQEKTFLSKDPSAWCATVPDGLERALARHRAFAPRRASRAAAASDPQVTQVGDVAVIEDDGTAVDPGRPFDLAGSSIQFLRRRDGLQVARSDVGWKNLIGEKLDVDDDGSARIRFPEGFDFPFFARKWRRMFVNANGNITFDFFDPASGVFPFQLSSRPRIAPFMTDLDPSAAKDGGGIYVIFLPHRVRITWLRVPTWLGDNENSFQVTLFDNGRILFTYGEIDTASAGVGVSSGGRPPSRTDYDADLPLDPQPAGVAEFFTNPTLDDLRAAEIFFQHFQDDYDQVVLFVDFDATFGPYAIPLNNDVEGIGRSVFSSTLPGSSRVQVVIHMGSVDSYPEDPDELIVPPYSSTSIVAHEFGHRWLAFPGFLDASGERSLDLLSRGSGHWSFFADSGVSVMHGNEIEDNGDGTFTTLVKQTAYSELDQYLMGLRPAAEVSPVFYVANPDISRGGFPVDGLTFAGERVDVSVDDIIAAEGERVPSHADAPQSFQVAFVVVGLEGRPPSPEAIEKVERFRRSFEEFFAAATDGRGQVSTTLLPRSGQ